MSQGREKEGGESNGLSPQDSTMLALLTRMRTGQLSGGALRPYSWLDLATQPKPEQQVKIERFFESCSFKSVLSYVVGKPKYQHNIVLTSLSPTLASSPCLTQFLSCNIKKLGVVLGRG